MRLLSIACAVAIGCAANHGNPHSPASKPRPQRNSSAACPITADTAVVVYTSTSGGVGPNSAEWTRRFFAWWADANPGQLTWLALDDPVAISTDCVFTDFPALRLYVQPGGDALNQSLALGPNGRDNLLNYIYYGYPNSHYMGTCAGAFYGAGSYWWYDNFEVNAFQPHWYPTVEGPITEIAAYPLYKPTTIVAEDGSESLTMIYWGGPASGLDYTTNKVPGFVRMRVCVSDDVCRGVLSKHPVRHWPSLANPNSLRTAGLSTHTSPTLPARYQRLQPTARCCSTALTQRRYVPLTPRCCPCHACVGVPRHLRNPGFLIYPPLAPLGRGCWDRVRPAVAAWMHHVRSAPAELAVPRAHYQRAHWLRVGCTNGTRQARVVADRSDVDRACSPACSFRSNGCNAR